MNAVVQTTEVSQAMMVRKPWGYEYLMFQNETVALWHLFIAQGAKTSLHCHPSKKTGLVLLSGDAEVSFLQGSVRLRPIDKLMVRPGLFHSTAGLSSPGAVVLEVETPRNKEDLVRLDDAYGREHLPYEGEEALIPLPADCLRFSPPPDGVPTWYELHGCRLCVEKAASVEALCSISDAAVIVVLEGGLRSRDGASVLGAGDVVSLTTVMRLARAFSAPSGLSVLTIRKREVMT